MRRGFSLLDIMIGAIIMTMTIGAMVKLGDLKRVNDLSIDAHYSVLGADAFFADIYSDFHSAIKCDIAGGTEMGESTTVTFLFDDGEFTTYMFVPDEDACYKNGKKQFDAKGMQANGTERNLYVNVMLNQGELMELDVYR